MVHVDHALRFVQQPLDIARPIAERPDPVSNLHGDEQFVKKTLKHRARERGYQFLTLTKGARKHDAAWQLTRGNIDRDGTVTELWQKYIREKGITAQYH